MSVNRLIGLSVGLSVDRSVRRSAGRSFSRSVGRSVDLSVSRLTVCSRPVSVSHQSTNQSISKTANISSDSHFTRAPGLLRRDRAKKETINHIDCGRPINRRSAFVRCRKINKLPAAKGLILIENCLVSCGVARLVEANQSCSCWQTIVCY